MTISPLVELARKLFRFMQRERAEKVGVLSVETYRLDFCDEFVEEFARLIVQAHFLPNTAASRGAFQAANAVPNRANDPDGTARKGEFGEIAAIVLYAGAFGVEVPPLKLHTKAAKGEPRRGADTLAVAFGNPQLGDVLPILVEAKVKTGSSPTASFVKKVLVQLESPAELAIGWLRAFEALDGHAEGQRSYAYLAAEQLSEHADVYHRRDFVVVCEGQGPKRNAWVDWPKLWSDSHASVLLVDNINTVVDAVFDRASQLTASHAIASSPVLLTDLHLEPDKRSVGIDHSPSSVATAIAITRSVSTPEDALLAGCLWILAGRFARGLAYLRLAGEPDVARPLTVFLRHLVGGDSEAACTAARSLGPWQTTADAVRKSAFEGSPWLSPSHVALREAGEALHSLVKVSTSANADADSRLVAAAVLATLERLSHHPFKLLGPYVVGRPVLSACVKRQVESVLALWPSQLRAVNAGLLNSEWKSFVARLPTASGKTLLIELLASSEVDTSPGGLTAVVVPSRALAQQLATSLRNVLPTRAVSLLLGGFDRDDTDALEPGLHQASVVVLTPERLELERRRNRNGFLDRLRMVIVDEAHHLFASGRGATLELCIAHLRVDSQCRFALFSSQIPDPTVLARWLGDDRGKWFADDVRPIPLDAWLYYVDDRVGYLLKHRGGAASLPVLRTYECERPEPNLFEQEVLDNPHESLPFVRGGKRRDQIACLAKFWSATGPVMIYAGIPDYANNVAESLMSILGLSHQHDGESLVNRALRCGIGLHHGGVTSVEKSKVESAARAGDLQYMIATSTLSEGIDFGLRTVLVGYDSRGVDPNQRVLKLDTATLRNLTGRAGRGDRYLDGAAILFAKTRADAEKMLLRLERELPPTRSALKESSELIADFAAKELGEAAKTLDSSLLGLLAEEIVDEGAIRHSVERLLGQSLCAFLMNPEERAGWVARSAWRAGQIRQTLLQGPIRTAIYRSGIPVESGRKLADDLAMIGVDPGDMSTNALLDTLVRVCAATNEIQVEMQKAGLKDAESLANIVSSWVRGESEANISSRWSTVKWPLARSKLLHGRLPWYLTAATEIWIATKSLEGPQAEKVRNRLQPSCVHHGTPDIRSAMLVRRGLPRERACELWAGFESFVSGEHDWMVFLDSNVTSHERRLLSDYLRVHAAYEVESPTDLDRGPSGWVDDEWHGSSTRQMTSPPL
jgi:superfamily II DNA/RNA helicase